MMGFAGGFRLLQACLVSYSFTRSRIDQEELDMALLDAFRLDGKVAIVTGASRGIGAVRPDRCPPDAGSGRRGHG